MVLLGVTISWQTSGQHPEDLSSRLGCQVCWHRGLQTPKPKVVLADNFWQPTLQSDTARNYTSQTVAFTFLLIYRWNKWDMFMNPDSSFVCNTQKWNWYWSSDLTAGKKANKLICPKYQTIPLTPISFSVSVFGDSSDLIGRPCRNKRCEAGLGERVAVFYEPLKFYSSLHRGSLRPRGHRALNKLSSFLYPLLPNICLPTPLPPNPSIHRLNGLFIVWCSSPTSSFFSPLSRSLYFALHLCAVVWRFEGCGLSAWWYYVLIHFACECVSPCLCWHHIHAVSL